MIILGDILAHDDVQQTISQLLAHVGSPSLHSATSRMFSHHSSHHHSSPHSHSSSCHSSHHHSLPHLHSRGSQSSSHGSRTGTHVIISDLPSSLLPLVIMSLSSIETLSSTPRGTSLVVFPSTSLDLPTPLVCNSASSLPTPVAHPASHSSCFPNVDLLD